MKKRAGQQSASRGQYPNRELKMCMTTKISLGSRRWFIVSHAVEINCGRCWYENRLCSLIFHRIWRLTLSDILFHIENIPISTGLTLNRCVSFGIAITAVIVLCLSPWDSPKGLCNLGWVTGGGYWDCTSGQRYLTINGSKWI